MTKKKTPAVAPLAPVDPLAPPAPPAPVDSLAIPAFLIRKREEPLPDVLTTEIVDDIEGFDRPLETAPEGIAILSMYLTEGGHRRFIVIKRGKTTAHCLYLPEMDHYEIELRDMNEQVSTGRAHWFACKPDLATRLTTKALKWDEYGFSYSRTLVNEALVQLGAPAIPLPARLDPATPEGKERQEKRQATRAQKGPGVIDTIIEILRTGGGTVAEMAVRLAAAFPDRDATGMTSTIRTQINRLPKQGKLVIVKLADKYYAEGHEPKAEKKPAKATPKKAPPKKKGKK